MNKKQRNRKQVKQNQRNKIINRRYSSTIKTLCKIFITQIKNLNLLTNNFQNINTTEHKSILELINLINLLFSIIDKATKKNVIHKNSAARKKSRISKIFFPIKKLKINL